jgi:hypothetical protein
VKSFNRSLKSEFIRIPAPIPPVGLGQFNYDIKGVEIRPAEKAVAKKADGHEAGRPEAPTSSP